MTSAQFKAARKKLGMNTAEFAAALGLRANGYRTIERIEAGGKITGPMELAILHLLSKHG